MKVFEPLARTTSRAAAKAGATQKVLLNNIGWLAYKAARGALADKNVRYDF